MTLRVACSVFLLLLASLPLAAWADFEVLSPDEIDYHEIEIEQNGSASFDKNDDLGGARSYSLEIGTGPTVWWHSELELDMDRDLANSPSTRLDGWTWDNMLQLTEPGEYWADVGLYGAYSHAMVKDSPDDILFGPLVQKDIGHTTEILNVFVTKELGPHQDDQGLDLSYAWQSRWNLSRALSPAIEVYGDAGAIDHPAKFQEEQLSGGPVLVGGQFLGGVGKVKYEFGYLFGLTNGSPAGILRWRLELEIPL